MEILTGNIDQKLTVYQQVHSRIPISTSYICIYGTFVTARVLRSYAEKHQTVLLTKHNRTRGAVYERLLLASTFHYHPLFSVLVDL